MVVRVSLKEPSHILAKQVDDFILSTELRADPEIACDAIGNTLDWAAKGASDRHEAPLPARSTFDDHAVRGDSHAGLGQLRGPRQRRVTRIDGRDRYFLAGRLGLAELSLPHDRRLDHRTLSLGSRSMCESRGRASASRPRAERRSPALGS